MSGLKLTTFVIALALGGCKQAHQLGPKPSQNAESSNQFQTFNLSAPSQVTGELSLAALFEDNQQQFVALALVECNSTDIEAASLATNNLTSYGARRQNLGRNVSVATISEDDSVQASTEQVDCHMIHPEAIIDAKSLTLINERIRGFSGFRTATRSDIAIYELAQLAWVGLAQSLAKVAPFVSDQFVDMQAPTPGKLFTENLNSQLALSAGIYDPCSPGVTSQLPRWLSADPTIRSRQFGCNQSKAHFRYDDQRTYPAVRHSLRSALVSLYRESRGMRPVFQAFQEHSERSGEYKFTLAPLFHSININ
jgi:hypothetical protein